MKLNKQCDYCQNTATRIRCSLCHSDTEHYECNEDMNLCDSCYKEEMDSRNIII